MLQLKAGQLLLQLDYAKALCQVCAAVHQSLLWLFEQHYTGTKEPTEHPCTTTCLV